MPDRVISALPEAGDLTGTELIPVVKAGNTVKTTTAELIRSLLAPLTPNIVPNHMIFGNRASSVPDGSILGLETAVNFEDPNEIIMQHYAGYSFFSGTPGPNAGSLQGGSCQSQVFNNGTGDITQAALGFEGIVGVNGDNGFKVGLAIGLQGSAFLDGDQDVDNLISVFASGPRRDSGTGTILNAYSFKADYPTHGTNRFSGHVTGRFHLQPIAGLNALEIMSLGATLQFAHDGNKLTGYASDGVSERIVIDSQDGAPERLNLSWFGTNKGITMNCIGGGTADFIDCKNAGTSRFRVANSGAMGTWGVAPPAAQPATPTDVATIVAALQAYGLVA